MWCNMFGHKWEAVVVGTDDNRFLACYCKRCNLGRDELTAYLILNKITNKYSSYNLKYLRGDNGKG